MVNCQPWYFTTPHPREDSLILTEQGAGWAPEPIWMFQRKNSLAPVGFEPQIIKPVAQSPYHHC